jgi:hypothetical protein
VIGATTTNAGLKVESALDTRRYQKGIKVNDAAMKRLDITPRHHPDQFLLNGTTRSSPARPEPLHLLFWMSSAEGRGSRLPYKLANM